MNLGQHRVYQKQQRATGDVFRLSLSSGDVRSSGVGPLVLDGFGHGDDCSVDKAMVSGMVGV